MLRFLPLIIFLTILASLFNYSSIKTELLYKLGLSGDTTTSCCNVDQLSKDGNFDEKPNLALFNNEVIDYPKTSLAQATTKSDFTNNEQTAVLGTKNAAGEEKWIEVSLDQQKLRAWEGNKIIMEFPISSGKWALTPTGDFNIWYKTRYQSMIGGKKEIGTYYNLPNVPNNMFFYQGYGLHGAYWHNNFGQPMSHGCINEPLANAAQIFDWAGPVLPEGQNAIKATADNPGTRVFIH